MQLVIEKSKFHGKPNNILQPISKPKSHKRNHSCFIKNISQNTPLNLANDKANFIEINREKAKQTEMISPLSKYYLNLNQLMTQKQQKIIKQVNFLKKYSKKSPRIEKQTQNKQSQKYTRIPTPRACHQKEKKSSRSKRQFAKKQKQLLICSKVQPLLKTRYKHVPLDISREYIVKSFQTIKYQYTFNRKISKPNSSFIKQSIQRLKKTIQKVSNRLMQTQINQHIQESQKRQIFEYKRMLSVIKQELEQMENSSRSERRRKSNKFITFNTQTTGLNKTEDECLNNAKRMNIDGETRQLDTYIDLSMSQSQITHQQYNIPNKSKSKNVPYELNKLNFQNKEHYNPRNKTNYNESHDNQSNLISFQQSSFNSSKSFDCQHEINPWQNTPEIIQDCEQANKRLTSIKSIKSSQNRINSGHIGSKNKFSILKQKTDQTEKKKISVRKSGIKFIKNSFNETSDTRRGSIARFIQNREQKDSTSIHHQTQGNQHQGKNKRHSDMSHAKVGKKGSKAHRSSIRDKNKEIENLNTEKSQLQIVENLISQTNFLQSQKSNSEDHNDEIRDTVDDQSKHQLSKMKKPILRSSNPILSILMLNQVEQSKDHGNNEQSRNSKSIPKVNQYNPKYIYIDSHKSFTHNAKLLSSEIAKMKKFLQANNCAVEQLFQIIQDKQRHIYPHVQKRSSSSKTLFNFQNKQIEPVFIAIKKNRMMVDSDDEPDMRSRYNDLVPLYYTEYTNPLDKGWIVFDEPLPLNKQKDQLYQQQMMQGVKLKDMLYFNRQYK